MAEIKGKGDTMAEIKGKSKGNSMAKGKGKGKSKGKSKDNRQCFRQGNGKDNRFARFRVHVAKLGSAQRCSVGYSQRGIHMFT